LAASGSLYIGPGPRPGPDILYRAPAKAPQLSNSGPWHAPPILVSGASAYRNGEFLYQDWLYDDHGAHEVSDPNYPGSSGDLFSKPNGTYDYPTGPGYASNAADLVEFRVKPKTQATLFRITLNTLENPTLIAFSIAIGGNPSHPLPFPDGANVVAPANLFLTVHPSGSKLVADLVHAASGAKAGGAAPSVRVDLHRRQITVSVPHSDWNPRRRTVRLAMGVGLWDNSAGRYLLPQAAADATHPGGAGPAANPPAFFDVAFRSNAQEPLEVVTAGLGVVTDPRWWRDEAQGTALAQGDITPFHANVSFAKLWRKATDNSQIPRTGVFDRILPSHFEPAQGADFSKECGLQGASNPSSCVPEYLGQLQPYAIYVPRRPTPPGGWGMTLLLHSLSANYNQYSGTRNQSQFALRQNPSIVITPEARGPDQFYEGLGEADVFEAWAQVAGLYKLNPAYTEITGYSMGGFGTFDVGSQFPDLFARAQPTVGEETDNNVLASMRNLPVLMWNVAGDELVGAQAFGPTEMKLANLGYRVELHIHQPCAAITTSAMCSAVFPNHLQLAINDQFAPAATFLGSALVDRNPAHVTYVADTARDSSKFGIVADHAYWISGVAPRSTGSEGTFDAISHGFGVGDPTPSGVQNGTGTIDGGNLGTINYVSQAQTWGSAPATPRADTIDITATNVAQAQINVQRAAVDCNAKLNITTDGPIAVTLAGCNRVVNAG
ncbi:MAG TPA: hypothetical protein VMU90_10915, partial [Solirubrobacteraceae bacterium]|nr:hypothetical protein [Solirubrobacteraceae bacterium]